MNYLMAIASLKLIFMEQFAGDNLLKIKKTQNIIMGGKMSGIFLALHFYVRFIICSTCKRDYTVDYHKVLEHLLLVNTTLHRNG